jgi:hypothetical protein
MTHLQTNGHNNTDKDKKMERKFNKMEKKTQLKKSGPAKPAYKAGEKENLIQDITNRFRVTAREARDIVTAVGNLGAVVRDKGNAGALGGTANQLKAAAKEVKKQVGETAKAATSGAKGTPSKKYMTITGDQPARLMGSNKRR